MDKYADLLVSGLRKRHSDLAITEVCPSVDTQRLLQIAGRFGKRFRLHVARWLSYPVQAGRTRADVYHVIDQSYGHLLYVLDHRKTIATCHDLVNYRYPELISQAARMPFLSLGLWKMAVSGLRRPRLVLADSECTRDDILRYLGRPTGSVRVVPLAADPVFAPRRERTRELQEFRRTQRLPDGKLIMHVGVNAPYKNMSGLIQALAILNTRLTTPATLIKVGSLAATEGALIRDLGLTAFVHWKERASIEELAWLYNAADVFAFPSLYEGFGMPVLEAMACGTPVIASTGGSLPSVVGNAGLLVEPTDVEGLADALSRVLSDDCLCQELSHRGFRQVSRYSWDTTVDQTASYYRMIYEKCRTPQEARLS